MKENRRIYHSPIEIEGDQTSYFLVLTEVCLITNRVLGTYTARLPEWVSESDNPDYRFYQPINN